MKKNIQVRHNRSKKLIIDKIIIGVTGGAPQKRVKIDQTWIEISRKLREKKAIKCLRQSKAWKAYRKGTNFQ